MLSKLNKKHLNAIEVIKKNSCKTGMNAYIVGGVVRDLILGKEIKDIDFLIEGSAIDFTKRGDFNIKSIHESFDTVKVLIEDEEYDIASTRYESYPNQGCLPVVERVGIKIEEDLKRRDFTINSIAYNLLNKEIIDPFGGVFDIQKKVLKILHKKSFLDDPTRILRGLDFKYRFDFSFEKETFKLLQECTKNYDNSHLSIDRIYLTLNKIFSSDNASKILSDIIDFDIYKIWTNFLGIKKEEIPSLEEAVLKFKVSEKNKIYIMALEAIPYIKAPLHDDFEIYNFFKKFKMENLCFYYFKTKDENALKYLTLKDIKPFVSGDILIKQGFVEGKIIGDILSDVLREKILNKEKFTSFEDELAYIFAKYKN